MELRRYPTTYGEIWLRGEADAFDADTPILLAIAPEFAADDHAFARLQPHFPDAGVLIGHVPGNHCPPLRQMTVEAFGAAYSEVVATLARPVVVLGESIGALAALAMRGPGVRGQVLLEPPLRTAGLWPLVAPLRKRLSSPSDRDLIENVLGYFEARVEDRDYRYLLGEVRVPTQVFWGAVPLGAPRAVKPSPSLVDEPERALVRAHPWVRTVLVRDAGHAVLANGGRAIVDACRHLLGDFATIRTPPRDHEPTEHALVRRTPLTARRVLYVGRAFASFEAELRKRHPSVDLHASHLPDPAEAFDCVAAADLRAADVPQIAAALRDGGDLIAVIPAMAPEAAAALRTAMDQAGLRVMAVHDPRLDDLLNDVRGGLEAGVDADLVLQPLVLAARKGPTPRRMAIQVAAYAPFGMDIRTRLPLEGLRSSPDVAVALCGVPAMPLPAADRPKVLILQRPTRTGFDLWRRELAQAIRHGWVTVMEFDDHPDLMAEMGGGETDWRLFSFTHAVQTSTPPLEAAFRPWNPEVRVFENAVFDLAPYPASRAPPRIFYGGLRRGPFAMQVAASMRRVAEAFPDVQFVVVGDRAIFDALPGTRNEFHELQPYARYLEIMSTCAISLSPIEDAPLLETKSDGKFLDASSRGLLTIASPTVYDRTIRHGETGLIAERLEDWAALTTEVLLDEAARERMAKAAWSYVRDRRMFAHQLPDRLAWYRSLWERRETLTEGLAARVPGLAEELAS